MPTDPVLTLIAEMRAKADAMPQDEYEVTTVCYDTTGDSECLHLPAHPINPHPNITIYPACDPMTEEHHAAYFASFDPALVRALLDVVEGQMMTDTLHTLDDDWSVNRRKRNAGMEALRQLAADRVAS